MKELKDKNTPLLRQYYKIKSKYPDTILLFRVGDFYETFGNDAIQCSKILDILLTKRSNGSNKIELAGFPYHVLHNYLPKILSSGFRVAICEQLENNKKNKTTLLKRGITEIITPGVNLNDQILDKKANNFLASIHQENDIIGLSFLDISTGEFLITEGNLQYIQQLIKRFHPSEILYNKKEKKNFEQNFGTKYYTYFMEDWLFQYETAYEKLISHFQTNSLKGFGIENYRLGIISSSIILHYLSETYFHNIHHISNIQRIEKENYVWMDDFTVKSLEINSTTHGQGMSLLQVLDKTISPMGARLLKRWINLPLKNIDHIKKRHDVVQNFLDNKGLGKKINCELKNISDIERLISKISTNKITPREVILLANSLKSIINIKNEFAKSESKIFNLFAQSIICCKSLYEKITNILISDPANQIGKGDVILQGVSQELDELRKLLSSNKYNLQKICNTEKTSTGINSLKIAFNNIFGYYIEIRKIYQSKVPSNWIIKQTLSNTIRYTTEKLKNYEIKILHAEENIIDIETKLFQNLVQEIYQSIKNLQLNAKYIANIDVLYSFSVCADANDYVRPQLNNSLDIYIKDGRHPVIEQQMKLRGNYISNDLTLNKQDQQIIIITGPNMSGKSAILRQTALIILMAQIGSYVPAKYAKIGWIDKIFSRVGASDNLSMGESTFMVEMNETANILNNFSERSLIILDEIGRGTSTYDGISIAYAIIEYIHNHIYQPKTLFATHYHEIHNMSKDLRRVKNYNILVKKINNEIIFMYKFIPGNSIYSFGIHVAKISGIPIQIINRSKEVIINIENIIYKNNNKIQYNLNYLKKIKIVYEELKNINIDNLTPINALIKLKKIKKYLIE